MIIVNSPLLGTINMDAITYFKVEGRKLVFFGHGIYMTMDCEDEIAANIAYKRIIAAFVAGEDLLYMTDLEE